MDDQLQEAIRLRQAGDYPAAQVIFAELLAASPDDPLVNYHFAWWHDVQGLEAGAVPFYERAIANGLSGTDLRGALLGLGSTYRSLGQYEQARATLLKGVEQFPDAQEFPVFLAMAHYNLGEHHTAMTLLLRSLAETSADAGIQRFKQAILFYADDLDQVWE
jgi:tetratricopeptide (TPR) repeat protein